MHFSWERMPQLTQARYQYEVSSKKGDKKNEVCIFKTMKNTRKA